MNNKGAFSIIAALLVAGILITTVIVTYSALRYSKVQESPQILSAIDETNLGIKQILGFTVGYYGSVLKVTGNQTYAHQLASNYLNSGLNNMGEIRPEWGATFEIDSLDLKVNWFSNTSYSQGTMNVNYDLTGLGISGISYTASTRLQVEIGKPTEANQAQLAIIRDNSEPLINLGKNNLKFYRYLFGNLTWELIQPTAITSYADGTYVIDMPSGVSAESYGIQVEDTRGIMVVATSFSQFTSAIAWNSSYVEPFTDYVDSENTVTGTHSNFSAQQSASDSVYDTLNEVVSGTFTTDNIPSSWVPFGNVSYSSGSLSDLQTDNSAYLLMRSYPTAYSSSYNTIGFDNQNSATSTTGTSMSWTHNTGIGNDRILLVSVDTFNSGGTPATVSSITYDGSALTQITTALYSSNPQVRSYVYYLLNPGSGTKTVSVSFSGSTAAVGGSITYTNVNQTTPYLASITNTNTGSSQSATLTASGSNSKVLFGHMGSYRTSQSYSITDGQTQRWLENGQQYKGVGSDKSVTSGSVSVSWTTSRTASWVAIAVLLQPTQVATSFGCTVEFSGSSDTINVQGLTWAINAASNASGVGVTYQLYNYTLGQYVSSGDGYLTDTLGTTDTTKTQTVGNPSDFRNASGNWKIKVIAAEQPNYFELKLDMMHYSTTQTNYALNLQEQWLSVNASNVKQDLCIKTGSFGSESLVVQVWHGGAWSNLLTLAPNFFNNVTLIPYIDSSTLAIRFVGGNDLTDPTSNSWDIDSVFIKPEKDINFLVNLQESTFTLELLQNGTMRWLGQNMQLTTQTFPIPPIPVKSLHVNETVNGVNQEVPFQIEDWASQYQIPLGITSNATVFSNRQMIVFQLNSKVADFTVWWDGSDNATQTPMAYTNRYFTGDDTTASTLNNGVVKLQFGSFNVKSTVVGTSTSSTAYFMRINQQNSTYGAGLAYVIHHGVVRDIVQQEAEWNNGPTNCPNLYANIVLTFPAQSDYYTYQLRLMFITSSQQRTITDLMPIELTTSLTNVQIQTENGVQAGFPILQNGTGTFSNTTAHHFSQFMSDTGKGAGIVFTDKDVSRLYTFDSAAGAFTGTLDVNVNNRLIQLLPVNLAQVRFTYAYDITWQGAVATFDNTVPICRMYDDTTPYGIWILTEYPPMLAVNAKS